MNRHASRLVATVRRWLGVDARDRTLDERFALLAEDTYAVLHGAAHEDPVTSAFRYTRADAALLLATASGLVNRHIRQR